MNAVDPRDVLTRQAALPEVVLRYAGHRDGIIDVHVPEAARDGGPVPLVVLVHGGFWRAGFDRLHNRPMARALVEEGYLVAAVEYRRVGPPPAEGGWPTTGTDVEAAVLALPGLLDGLGLAATTTSLVGHSAGGHLVLWLASRPGVTADRVVALAPVADLRAAARERLGDGATQDLLGGGPDEVPERYADADPLTLLDPGTAPPGRIVLVHGTDDDVVPVSQSRSLAAALPDVGLRELPGAGHFEVIDPLSTAWPTVLDALGSPPPSGPAAG
ncbi:alpha/beta hydrolase family protein [Nocardioides mesophilus]|uniref:Alpha/beta hydrolase n=1 Tax=Nocardioides mesophilus TaxID=433659 RepID=A0A7G9RGC1_9ACTN|nr:alpha/beta hydrolase [Nocardioides mesophilus]QNN54646.1 alpha/beta hydrolase [Nocardioides mesophilus]